MIDDRILQVSAITKVFPEGQKCIRIVVEYNVIIAESSVCPDGFYVKSLMGNCTYVRRSVTDAYSSDTFDGKKGNGRYVIIDLSPEDEAASTFMPGDAFSGIGARVIPVKITVEQVKDLLDISDEKIAPDGVRENDTVINELVDEFVQGSFEGLAYNLYIPKDYNPEKCYPLVQFIHDASVCGKQEECTLAQGLGALVWMTNKEQKKHPCFVLAPQFNIPSVVDDDWNVDHRLEICKRLLDKIVSEYSIDTDRLYTTGQSMGCMSSMVLNLRYPDLFAASLFVAGQWDETLFSGSGLEKKNFWFINSMGDAKAFPIMNQILVALERDGAEIARGLLNAKASTEELNRKAGELISSGANMIYTPFEIESIANGWHSDGGEHHVNTWRFAYSIEAVHDWLFDQKKQR